ncbi:MAG: hypothetical protein KGS45_14175 [Planctomycetes bacterium]|nr:hypothetical protein [Planctomycetota bacterium]
MAIDMASLSLPAANNARIFWMLARSLSPARLSDVPPLFDLTKLGAAPLSADEQIISFLSTRPKPSETEVLLEMVCETPEDSTWHLERVGACSLLLSFQGMHDNINVEMRDSALPAFVESIRTSGQDWIDAGFRFMLWVVAQPRPYRSLGLDLIACSLLAGRLAPDLARAACEQVRCEIDMYDRRADYPFHPPQIGYSAAVQSEWMLVLENGAGTIEGARCHYEALKEIILLR